MPAQDPFGLYLSALRKTTSDQKTEHTDRSALEALLQSLADGAGDGISVQHEPKRDALRGAPDYKVAHKGLILGYVETKKIGDNLDKVLKSDQITKYRSLSPNIILTDYLHFIWITPSGVLRESLCHETDLESKKFRLSVDRVEAVQQLLRGFLSSPPEGIGQASKLAVALATRARMLRDFLHLELSRQDAQHQEGRLLGLYQVFQRQVFQELTLKEFADAFAQMLAYGLFLARLNSDLTTVTLRNARDFVPSSFQLIRELVDFLSVLEQKEYADVRWVVEEILSIVNGLDLLAIHEDLSFRHRKASSKIRARDEEEHRLFERDPFIYFYEDFLTHYDKETRKARGVYYTPPPVVSFIVRAVDDILKDTFEIKDGLADHQRVTVLDFACGTGTFLLEVFQRVFDNIGGANAGHADLIVREHLLKNIYGFEYLIAPYTIAHLKLSQYLREQQLPLKDGERLRVFLTNTLEPINPAPNFLLPAVTAEAEAAQAVKEKPLLVIVGNPPYSGHSKNKGAWITSAIKGYKFTIETNVNGLEEKKPLGERNPKWLNDDYVKFLRFAQLKMDEVEEGVVGVITNHSWLDNPTFRGMRQSLMRTFQQIYVLDLHGNTTKKERTPDGSKDENVFDIKQGVSISVFVKKKGLPSGIWRGDIWGSRKSKYSCVASEKVNNVCINKITVKPDQFLFLHRNPESAVAEKEYAIFFSVLNIFPNSSPGLITARDHFALAFSEDELIKNVSELLDSSNSDDFLRRKFELNDTREWSLAKARMLLLDGPDWRKAIRSILAAPFDQRSVPLEERLVDWGRLKFLSRVEENPLGICLPRKIDIQRPWEHVLISDKFITHHALSMKEVNYFFPVLYDHRENLSPNFRSFLDHHYAHHYAPEEVLGYIYAVLHAPSYRRRYADFLRIDFPRIPFTQQREEFDRLSALGWALVQAHLLRECPRKGLAKYTGKGDHCVGAVAWAEADGRLYINKTQSFAPVPEQVWRFTIGGYQVLDKYLKSRKGRILTLDEIQHISQVADSLAFTIEQMRLIDDAWERAFPDYV